MGRMHPLCSLDWQGGKWHSVILPLLLSPLIMHIDLGTQHKTAEKLLIFHPNARSIRYISYAQISPYHVNRQLISLVASRS